MKLYFVRHGESEANVLNEISNRGRKHGLTEKGKRQAANLAQSLKAVTISRIYSSPLLRAVQTAEILARGLHVEFEVTKALREYDCGVIEGKSDPQSWEIYNQVKAAWIQQRLWHKRIPQGESFLDIRDRFVPFILRLLKDAPQNNESIILVGHGGLYTCMLPLVLTNIDFDLATEHPMPNTAYIVAESRSKGLQCVEWCGTLVD